MTIEQQLLSQLSMVMWNHQHAEQLTKEHAAILQKEIDDLLSNPTIETVYPGQGRTIEQPTEKDVYGQVRTEEIAV